MSIRCKLFGHRRREDAIEMVSQYQARYGAFVLATPATLRDILNPHYPGWSRCARCSEQMPEIIGWVLRIEEVERMQLAAAGA